MNIIVISFARFFPMVKGIFGTQWLSLIGQGISLGLYDKVHPVTSTSDYTQFEQGVTPGSIAPVFELDFG